ncbi:transposase [Saccharothrix sp. ALI-22-I]|uniref:transposase n=1 Tax=Saccharothrix sp. ALI-22-I TaxID=1933778 RepID=UPI0009FE4470|nr:transposase [Saccharothrix sp. ALI-22-I]
MCFEDEAGHTLRPPKARTWAPRGQTPVIPVSGKGSGRISVAGLFCVRPGRRPHLLYRVKVHRARKGERRSFTETDYAALLDAAHQYLKAEILVIWDNLNTHISTAMRHLVAGRDWLHVIQPPAYAPDLNPTEGVWSHVKRDRVGRVQLGQRRGGVLGGVDHFGPDPLLRRHLLTRPRCGSTDVDLPPRGRGVIRAAVDGRQRLDGQHHQQQRHAAPLDEHRDGDRNPDHDPSAPRPAGFIPSILPPAPSSREPTRPGRHPDRYIRMYAGPVRRRRCPSAARPGARAARRVGSPVRIQAGSRHGPARWARSVSTRGLYRRVVDGEVTAAVVSSGEARLG